MDGIVEMDGFDSKVSGQKTNESPYVNYGLNFYS